MEFSLHWISDPTAWLGLATLIALEIVLGVDNLIFIAIVADKLPPEQRDRARVIGLSLALFMRLALLTGISWLTSLTRPLVTVFGFGLSGRDMILIAGGAFLLFKATTELHERLEGVSHEHSGASIRAGFWATVLQIIVLDAVFSIDSIVTAVGMVNELTLMMIAVMVAIAVMMVASGPLMRFVSAHPTVVVLCLGFLLMIGFSLVLDGFHVHVPKGYLYAAIGFSVLIEALNQIGQRNRRRLALQGRALRARAADAVVRLLGGARGGAAQIQDEIAALAGSIEKSPVFTPVEEEMVSRVMGLADRPVRSVMTPRRDVVWLDVTGPPDRLREQVLGADRSHYPLARGTLDNLVGVAHAHHILRDLDRRQTIDASTCERQPIVVPEETSALLLLERFRAERNHFAVVVNEYGEVQGVATPMDLLEAIAGALPEPGEVRRTGERQPDGAWLFDGDTELGRVHRALGLRPPAEAPYKTVGAAIFSSLHRLPQPGESIERDGLRLEVVSLDGQHIEKVRVRRMHASAGAERPVDGSTEKVASPDR
jgi:CBS domain containing-hemolysin-like protein